MIFFLKTVANLSETPATEYGLIVNAGDTHFSLSAYIFQCFSMRKYLWEGGRTIKSDGLSSSLFIFLTISSSLIANIFLIDL